MKETDLYAPVKRFLEAQGYEVKGEVQDCDVLAVRGQESPVVVELKLNLNLQLLLQAVERVALTDKVYVGVPESCRVIKTHRKRLLKLLRMLGLGLLTIEPDKDRVGVLLDPGGYKPRPSKPKLGRLLGEFHRRVGDPNAGGSTGRGGLMTAYRQRALAIARYLEEHGPTKASVIAGALAEPKARAVMYDNVYGWFERVSTGVYALSPRGRCELPGWSAGRGIPELEEKVMSDPYAELRAHFDDVEGVQVNAGRGAQGIKLGGKMFAMFHKGQLLVKLEPKRVLEVIASGDGLAHDPGTGIPMKNRVLIPDTNKGQWIALCEESRQYEARLGGRSR